MSDRIVSIQQFGRKEHLQQLRSTERPCMQRLAGFKQLEDSVWREDKNDRMAAM